MRKTYYSGGRAADITWRKDNKGGQVLESVETRPATEGGVKKIGKTVVFSPSKRSSSNPTAVFSPTSKGKSVLKKKPDISVAVDGDVAQARKEFDDVFSSLNRSILYSPKDHPKYCRFETETHDKYRAPPPNWPNPSKEETSTETLGSSLTSTAASKKSPETETHEKFQGPPDGWNTGREKPIIHKDQVQLQGPDDPPTPKINIKSIKYSGTENHDKFKGPPEGWKRPVLGKERPESINLDLSSNSISATPEEELKHLRDQFDEELSRLHRTDIPVTYTSEYKDSFKSDESAGGQEIESEREPETEYASRFQDFTNFDDSSTAPAGLSEKNHSTGKRVFIQPSDNITLLFQEDRSSKPKLSIDTEERVVINRESGKKDQSQKVDGFLTQYQLSFCSPKNDKRQKREPRIPELDKSEYQRSYQSPVAKKKKVLEAMKNNQDEEEPGPPYSEYMSAYDHLPSPKARAKMEAAAKAELAQKKIAGDTSKKDSQVRSLRTVPLGLASTTSNILGLGRDNKSRAVAKRDSNILQWWEHSGKNMWSALNPITKFPRYNPFSNLMKTPRTEYMDSFRKFI